MDLSPRTRIAKLHLRQQREMQNLKLKHNAELEKLHTELDHKNAEEGAALKQRQQKDEVPQASREAVGFNKLWNALRDMKFG